MGSVQAVGDESDGKEGNRTRDEPYSPGPECDNGRWPWGRRSRRSLASSRAEASPMIRRRDTV